MSFDDNLFEEYIQEKQDLDSFRSNHSGLFKDTPIESEDPNTERIIEAIAFFTAKARMQGMKKITRIHQSLFRQYFPYLINPLPAIAMTQMIPSQPKKTSLPSGTEIFFKTSTKHKATFQTLDTISLLPLTMKSFTFERKEKQGWLCSLHFSLVHPMNSDVGDFPLYINHMHSFFSSVTVLFALQNSLEKLEIEFDPGEENSKVLPCKFKLGYSPKERKTFDHILEQVRGLFHCPQQELFLNCKVPECPNTQWQKFTLHLHLDQRWPENLELKEDSFLPFVVPVINLKTEYADPIDCDGTRDNYEILNPHPTQKYMLHTVKEALEHLPSGTKPLKPGMLGSQDRTYDIDYFEKNIQFHLKGAFENPKRISVLAHWTQPWFTEHIHKELFLQFVPEQFQALKLKLVSPIHPFESNLQRDPHQLIQILSLKNQNFISLQEILFILNAIKDFENSYFDGVAVQIKSLEVSQILDQESLQSTIIYQFFLKELEKQKWEVCILFFKYLHALLNSWLASYEVEIKVHFSNVKKPITIKKGLEDELPVLAGAHLSN